MGTGAQASPYYDVSAIHALKMVEANKDWLNGSIAYAEAHAFSTRLHKWLNIMVAPLPDKYSALIEAVEDSNGDKGGFWVRFIDIRELVVQKRIQWLRHRSCQGRRHPGHYMTPAGRGLARTNYAALPMPDAWAFAASPA